MSPLTRNLALTAAAISIPAVLAALAGPDRVRQLPGQMRDLLVDDDSVEGQLKRLTHRLNSLTNDLHIHTTDRDRLVQAGRVAAVFGAVLLVPAALAAWIGPEKIRRKARQYRKDFMSDSGMEREGRDFADDLDDLGDDIRQQRDDAYDAVTRAARDVRD